MRTILFYIFGVLFVVGKNNVDTLKKYKSINLRIDYSTNVLFKRTISELFFNSRFKTVKFWNFSFCPQYNILHKKVNKERILGFYLGMEKVILSLPKDFIHSEYLIENFNFEYRRFEYYNLKFGTNYFAIYKRNLGWGVGLQCINIFIFNLLDGKYKYEYNYYSEGILFYNKYINLDISFSLHALYKWKKKLIGINIISPNIAQGEYFSIGINFITPLFYVTKRN